MEPCIEINGLTKRFGKKVAVDNLNLTVPKGAIFALLGDNGAGKTTTIRMLCGLLKPGSGTATVMGNNCWSGSVQLRQNIGYVSERPRYYDWMTIEDVGRFNAGFQNPDYMERYLSRAQSFGLEPHAKLTSLSKGQYAKIGLSLALAIDPEVLVLDEPTSGLDLLVRREFLSSMIGLAEEGRTVLISSHMIAEIERIASHVAFMAKGKLMLTCTMDELRERIVRIRLRFEDQPPEAQHLGTVLQRNGVGKQWQAIVRDPNRPAIDSLRGTQGIHDFEEAPLNLEEVYTAMMSPGS